MGTSRGVVVAGLRDERPRRARISREDGVVAAPQGIGGHSAAYRQSQLVPDAPCLAGTATRNGVLPFCRRFGRIHRRRVRCRAHLFRRRPVIVGGARRPDDDVVEVPAFVEVGRLIARIEGEPQQDGLVGIGREVEGGGLPGGGTIHQQAAKLVVGQRTEIAPAISGDLNRRHIEAVEVLRVQEVVEPQGVGPAPEGDRRRGQRRALPITRIVIEAVEISEIEGSGEGVPGVGAPVPRPSPLQAGDDIADRESLRPNLEVRPEQRAIFNRKRQDTRDASAGFKDGDAGGAGGRNVAGRDRGSQLLRAVIRRGAVCPVPADDAPSVETRAVDGQRETRSARRDAPGRERFELEGQIADRKGQRVGGRSPWGRGAHQRGSR